MQADRNLHHLLSTPDLSKDPMSLIIDEVVLQTIHNTSKQGGNV